MTIEKQRLDPPLGLVSAVIPTQGRPDLVSRAVRSALDQTLQEIEVIVVVDGGDPSTEARLAAIDDARLRVIVLPQCSGAAAARNGGVTAARGEWIAFLDDDDAWLPEKLEQQLEAARASPAANPIISCQIIARTSRGAFVWPKRAPLPTEHLSDYLLDRPSPFSRPGFLATPTLFARRGLLLDVPMPNYPIHEDWAWLLDVTRREDVRIEFISHPLCMVTVDDALPSQTKRASWRLSLSWIDAYRDRVTPRAYAAFLLTSIARKARREGDWMAFWRLWRRAFRRGRPRVAHLIMYLATWAVPPGFHRWLRQLSYADSAGKLTARPTPDR